MNQIELILSAVLIVTPFYMYAVRKGRKRDLKAIADRYNEMMKDCCLGGVK